MVFYPYHKLHNPTVKGIYIINRQISTKVLISIITTLLLFGHLYCTYSTLEETKSKDIVQLDDFDPIFIDANPFTQSTVYSQNYQQLSHIKIILDDSISLPEQRAPPVNL